MSRSPEPPLNLKQNAFNNQGFLTEEQMAKVFRELLQRVKIVKELHDRDDEGGAIDRIDQPVWEAKEITFDFSAINISFSRAALSGTTGKATAKSVIKLTQQFARSRAPLKYGFSVWGMRHAKLGVEFEITLEAKKSGAALSFDLESKEASLTSRKQLFTELISTAKLAVAITEAGGKLTFDPTDSADKGQLKVTFPAGKIDLAIEAFFSVCAHNQLRYKEASWNVEGEDGHFTKCPQLPLIVQALGAAKLPAKEVEVFWCGWKLKRWQDWPLLLTAANYYDSIFYLMPFQAAMPSGCEFQLWLNATPKKGFKFAVRLDRAEHIHEFVGLTTAKMKSAPDLSDGWQKR